jgi:hypothetical protein
MPLLDASCRDPLLSRLSHCGAIRALLHPSESDRRRSSRRATGPPIPLWMSIEPARLPAPCSVVDQQPRQRCADRRAARAPPPLERRDSRVTSAQRSLPRGVRGSPARLSRRDAIPRSALLALLIAGYAVASKVEFGRHWLGDPDPARLRPDALLLLPAMVPLCVAVGLLLGNAATLSETAGAPGARARRGRELLERRRRRPRHRARRGRCRLSVWPVLLAAVLAQFTFDSSARRPAPGSRSASPRRQRAPDGVGVMVDLALAHRPPDGEIVAA